MTDAAKRLQAIFGKVDNPWKCDWRTCFFGMGLAGRESCHGQPENADCPEYKNEEEELERWRRRDVLFRRF